MSFVLEARTENEVDIAPQKHEHSNVLIFFGFGTKRFLKGFVQKTVT